MIILPNSLERYLASLRYLVTLSIAKHGTKKQHLKNLRKIYTAETYIERNLKQSVDISRLSRNLLGAISCFKNDLKFSCSASGNFYINKKLFILLLILISKKSNNIKLSSNDDCVFIKYSGMVSKIAVILKAMNGICFVERKTETSLIILPLIKSNQHSVYIESEWENIFDNFSPVNIFFN